MKQDHTSTAPLAENKLINKWVTLALINLAIVGILGFAIRSKILFPISLFVYKNALHAHSHFAMGGWVTLAILMLMRFQLLPASVGGKVIYRNLLWAVQLIALGMLLSFFMGGYSFFSILFSTLFIVVTFWFAVVFIADLKEASLSKPVKLLAKWSLIYMMLSALGSLGMIYLMASGTQNVFLAKDAIYTYLHMQYNGFFTLAIIALFLQKIGNNSLAEMRFAQLLNYAVVPSLFMSYLWHLKSPVIYIIAGVGSLLVLLTIAYFFIWLRTAPFFTPSPAKRLLFISLGAFALKLLFQSLTIIPQLGHLVFANRPVIIGFLHLVMLCFVSFGLLVLFIEGHHLRLSLLVKVGMALFVFSVLANEAVLFTQGLGFMLMLSSSVAGWLLWGITIGMMSGAMMLAAGKIFQKNGPTLS